MTKRIPAGIRRLKTLSKYLRKSVPREHFDIRWWIAHNNDPQLIFDNDSHDIATTIDNEGKLTPDRLLTCNTVGCAVGWAAVCPALQKEGLTLKRSWSGSLVPKFSIYDGFNAVREFFEFERTADADRIFNDTRAYPHRVEKRQITPTDVADVIDQYIAQHTSR